MEGTSASEEEKLTEEMYRMLLKVEQLNLKLRDAFASVKRDSISSITALRNINDVGAKIKSQLSLMTDCVLRDEQSLRQLKKLPGTSQLSRNDKVQPVFFNMKKTTEYYNESTSEKEHLTYDEVMDRTILKFRKINLELTMLLAILKRNSASMITLLRNINDATEYIKRHFNFLQVALLRGVLCIHRFRNSLDILQLSSEIYPILINTDSDEENFTSNVRMLLRSMETILQQTNLDFASTITTSLSDINASIKRQFSLMQHNFQRAEQCFHRLKNFAGTSQLSSEEPSNLELNDDASFAIGTSTGALTPDYRPGQEIIDETSNGKRKTTICVDVEKRPRKE